MRCVVLEGGRLAGSQGVIAADFAPGLGWYACFKARFGGDLVAAARVAASCVNQASAPLLAIN